MAAVLSQAGTRHRVQTSSGVRPVSCPTCIVAFAQGLLGRSFIQQLLFI